MRYFMDHFIDFNNLQKYTYIHLVVNVSNQTAQEHNNHQTACA